MEIEGADGRDIRSPQDREFQRVVVRCSQNGRRGRVEGVYG